MSHEEKAGGEQGPASATDAQNNVTGQQNIRHDSADHIPQAPVDQFVPLQPIDNEITFQKRTVPKQRTQSVQSVLSSVSLKSFVHQKQLQQQQNLHQQNLQAQKQQQQGQQDQQNQQQGTQAQFISAKTHIQAPATAASSKRRASFEIGQRLPFLKDDKDEGEHAVVSDDEAIQQEEQKRLTTDALKRLSSFGKFTPAEVDITIPTKRADEEDIKQAGVQEKIDTNIPFRSASASQIQTMRPLSAQSSRVLTRNVSNLSPVQHSDIDTETNINGSSTHPHVNPNDYIGPPASVSNTASPKHKMHITLPQTNDIQSTSMVATPSSNSSVDNTNLKTISDPKRPMYLPAVLRQSNTNLKPEDVEHINEQNSRKYSKSLLQEAAHSIRSQSSHWSLRLDASSAKSPTRAHWRRDITRNSCAQCEKSFSFFERRHHCRRCGDIFCAEHTSHLLKLGLDAQFTLGGKGLLCKVCDNCCRDYETFVKRELGESAINGVKKTGNVTNDDQSKQSNTEGNNVVGVVPADWSWSSF